MHAGATLDRDLLMPRPPAGMGRGLGLALLVHLGLIGALAFGVNWRRSEPQGLEAELWSSVPQVAAPRAVEPPPPPPPPPRPTRVEPAQPAQQAREAQIAIEKERERKQKLKQEQEQAERQREEQRKKAEADKKEAERKRRQLEEQEKRLAAERERNLQEIIRKAGGGPGNSPGTAAQTSGPSAGYAGRIKARVLPNIVFTETTTRNPVAEVEVRLAPDGHILSTRLLKPSGMAAWDDAVLRAMERTEVLPRDVDGRVPSVMVLTFSPNER